MFVFQPQVCLSVSLTSGHRYLPLIDAGKQKVVLVPVSVLYRDDQLQLSQRLDAGFHAVAVVPAFYIAHQFQKLLLRVHQGL